MKIEAPRQSRPFAKEFVSNGLNSKLRCIHLCVRSLFVFVWLFLIRFFFYLRMNCVRWKFYCDAWLCVQQSHKQYIRSSIEGILNADAMNIIYFIIGTHTFTMAIQATVRAGARTWTRVAIFSFLLHSMKIDVGPKYVRKIAWPHDYWMRKEDHNHKIQR